MKDKNGKEVKLHDKISVNPATQPIFEIVGFRGTTLLLKCVDTKGDAEMFADDKTLLLPQSALALNEIVK